MIDCHYAEICATALAGDLPIGVNMIMPGFALKLMDMSMEEAHQVMKEISHEHSLQEIIKAIGIGHPQMKWLKE